MGLFKNLFGKNSAENESPVVEKSPQPMVIDMSKSQEEKSSAYGD